MEHGGPALDFSDTEVYFSSYDALVPFRNLSDAALARLSVQKGVTLTAVQAVLDLIVFNPSFNSREVTLTSAGSIDEVVAEYREAQVSRRASGGGKEMVSGNGATSALAIGLVVSQMRQDMVPFLEDTRTDPTRNFELLMTMSLVHRSWTMSAQELLFRRVAGTMDSDRDLVRRLLQHPYYSVIRELHLEVGCMSTDDINLFAHLLRRLSSLRKLSLSIWIDWDKEDKGDSDVSRDNICAKIYSGIAQRLPNLTELWIDHSRSTLLEDCVGRILQGKSGAAPFVLKDLLITDPWSDDFGSVMLLSPAKVHSIAHHKASHNPPTYSSPHVHNSGDISKCSVAIDIRDGRQIGPLLARFFDTGGLFGDIHPQISNFTFYCFTKEPQVPVDQFLGRFLGRCTSLENMILFVPGSSSQEMSTIPFSRISKSLRVLSMYYPYPGQFSTQERPARLERVVQTMCDRGTGSSLERVEITFCRDLRTAFKMRTLQLEDVNIDPPEYLEPARRMCYELNIDLVCRAVGWGYGCGSAS